MEQLCGVCGLQPFVLRLKGTTAVVARSRSMQGVLKRVARFATSSAPVVIMGETGTGKEVVARMLHASSARAKHPFVAVNVAALPSELLESELFGHGKGAFTGASSARRGLFEAAEGGTLLLDEVGEMPLPLQAKLLRAVQDGEIRRVGETDAFAVDVRIVCATHRDLAGCVRDGSFRQDLYYRLKVLSVAVPPLRERRDDILRLAEGLLAHEQPALRGFTEAARERLLAHTWPGNVRELENAIKHGAALATGPEVDADDLPVDLGVLTIHEPMPASPHRDLRSLAEVERTHIQDVLKACGGSHTEAARILGIGRNTLWRKIRSIDAPVVSST